MSALDVLARRLALDSRRSSDVFVLALAVEAADRVGADGVRAARLGLALVHVEAGRALRDEALLAEALVLYALRVVRTVKVGLAQDVHVHLKAEERKSSAVVPRLGSLPK